MLSCYAHHLSSFATLRISRWVEILRYAQDDRADFDG